MAALIKLNSIEETSTSARTTLIKRRNKRGRTPRKIKVEVLHQTTKLKIKMESTTNKKRKTMKRMMMTTR